MLSKIATLDESHQAQSIHSAFTHSTIYHFSWQGHVYVENVPAMMLIHQGTGVTSMETHASVMRGAAMLHMTDTQTGSALVKNKIINLPTAF